MQYNKHTIIALDFQTLDEVKSLISKLQNLKDDNPLVYVKVGMELFYAEGPAVIKYLKEQNLKVFLDLKVHDIPNTAYGAVRSLVKLGVDMINVHAGGSIKMMQKAKAAIDEFCQDTSNKPLLIGVTQLTSTDQETLNDELKISGTVEESVINLAQNTKTAGLDGIVCSALEVPSIKAKLGQEFITVCPGIRPKGSSTDDQKRVVTPQDAFEKGADYIVVGRAVTQASDPRAAFEKIIDFSHGYAKS